MSEESDSDNWNGCNLYKIRDQRELVVVEDKNLDQEKEQKKYRSEIEPWLTALFQSEHLSLLLGSGISRSLHELASKEGEKDEKAGIAEMPFTVFKEQIDKSSRESASKAGRGGQPNIEDQIRVCNELIRGLDIYTSEDVYGYKKIRRNLGKLKEQLEEELKRFTNSVLKCEYNIIHGKDAQEAAKYLMSFLVSFASRSATRERLNIFTTNYDRIIEYGAELAGIRLIDRFVGTVNPIFRSSRVEVDMHYNPPGIRGEPRYLEGVVHFSKIHGSLDWSMKDRIVRRFALPYGAEDISTYLDEECQNLLIYPNAAKDRETSEYPYVELFRDFAVAICRANSTVVVYGYSFGDDHINRAIADMLTIPSTHLVIISFDDQGGRIKRFYDKVKRPAQISLLIGDHFGDLQTLVDNYLPKPAIDRTTIKMAELLKARGIITSHSGNDKEES